MTRAPAVDHDEVLRLVAQQQALVIDALPPKEYAKQHLPGAINLPIEKFQPDDVSDIDRDQTIITYCADGQCDLSARAAARLQLEGFRHVFEYLGGIAEWGAYGLPFEGENADVLTAGSLAARDLPTCGPDDPAGDIDFGEHSVAAVVNGDGVFLGRLLKSDVESQPNAAARSVMATGASTFRPDVYITEMADWFTKRAQRAEFIITTPDSRVYGVLYRSAVEHLMNELHAAHQAR